MELKDKKRVLYDGLKAVQKDFEFSKPFKAKFTVKIEGFEVLFDDQTRMILTVHRASQNYGPDEFAAYSNFSVFGGPLYALILERLSDGKARSRDGKLVQGTSSSVVPREDYEFVSTANTEALTRALMDDIRKSMLPFAKAFVEDYARAIEGMLDGSILTRANVRNPFVLTLALLATTKRQDLVGKLMTVASKDERFYDFHEAGTEGKPTADELVKLFAKSS